MKEASFFMKKKLKKLKKKLKKFLQNNPLLRKTYRAVLFAKRKHTFKGFQKSLPLEEKTIFFEAFQGRLVACSPKAMYLAAVNHPDYADYTFVWSVRNPKNHKELKAMPRTKVIKWGTKTHLRVLATAKYWVTNSTMPVYVTPSQDQVFIQTWHGTPLKRLGCDLTHSENSAQNLREIHKQYLSQGKKISTFLSPSEFYTQKIGSAYRQPAQKFVHCGYPRNDFLFNYTPEDVARVKEKLGIPSGKKVLLYAPTFRDNNYERGKGFHYDLGIDLALLQQTLGGDYVVLFRTHYFVVDKFDLKPYEGFIIDVSRYDDINELYIVSDMLVTDYSSVFFDYANLNRPMLFFMYDYELYKGQLRDFYIDVTTLPGPIVYENDQLGKAILELEQSFVYDEAYKEFNKIYNTYNDGQSSIRALQSCIKEK